MGHNEIIEENSMTNLVDYNISYMEKRRSCDIVKTIRYFCKKNNIKYKIKKKGVDTIVMVYQKDYKIVNAFVDELPKFLFITTEIFEDK